MYRVKYYMSGDSLVSKYFKTLSEAIRFSVYGKIGPMNLYGIDKVEE